MSGGSVALAGDTLLDATSDTIQKIGQAEVELKIQDGLIVGVNVVNGGFGFTKLPEITINSDTGAVLNYYQFLNSLKLMTHLNLLR